MVLLLVGIVVGIIIAVILITKYFKTNPRDILGFESKCQKCGLELDGIKCPRCEKDNQYFGV